MGTMISRVNEIDRLRFEPFPTRAIALKACVRIDTMLMAVGNDGRIYTNSALCRKAAAFLPGDWPWLREAMEGLVRLKLASPDLIRQHMAYCLANERRREAKWILDHVVPDLDKLGVRLSSEDIAKIQRAAGVKLP